MFRVASLGQGRASWRLTRTPSFTLLCVVLGAACTDGPPALRSGAVTADAGVEGFEEQSGRPAPSGDALRGQGGRATAGDAGLADSWLAAASDVNSDGALADIGDDDGAGQGTRPPDATHRDATPADAMAPDGAAPDISEPAVCVDACERSGQRSCEGQGWRSCQRNPDGCLAWSALNHCQSGQTCQSGQCISTNACSEDCQAVNLHTTFSDDPARSVWVSWRGETGNRIEYGPTTAYGETAEGSALASNGGQQHHVELTGLRPATRYYYRVSGSLATGSFETAPAAGRDFSFVIPGDIQYGAGINRRWQQAHQWVLANHPRPIGFWVALGDQVSLGLQQSHWDAFFRSSGAAVRDFVFMPMIGNHETYITHDHQEYIPQPYLDQFRLPRNGDQHFEGYWYHFEYGDALFIVMSWLVTPDDDQGMRTRLLDGQTRWLESVLTETDKKWRFVLLHAPVYSTAGRRRLMDARPQWSELWETHRVNAVINGDTHFYEYSVPIYRDEAVSSYAEGTLYYGTAGIRGSPTGGRDWWTADSQQSEDLPLVAVVDVSEDTATITTYNYDDGSTRSQVVLPARQ